MTTAQRIAAKTIRSGECLVWIGARHTAGYGKLWPGGTRLECSGPDLAHRVSYREFVGPIPEGYEIHHTCRNRACVEPAHLVALPVYEHHHHHGTTHCRKGHDLAETGRPWGTRRICRTCRNDYQRAKYAARRKAA